MSDILIKNMELPRFETKRLALFPDGRVAEIKGYDLFLVDAKAIELPEHGDLIDIDLAIEDFAEKHCRYGACIGKACKDCDYYYLIGFFKTSRRKVVEANNGSDN